MEYGDSSEMTSGGFVVNAPSTFSLVNMSRDLLLSSPEYIDAQPTNSVVLLPFRKVVASM